MRAPVAFLIFNRPGQTARVFEAIRASRPRVLLVVADGPRDDAERERCEQTRAVVRDGVDWPCDVRWRTSDTNLGCKRCVAGGLDWVFRECDEAIVLEDDCLPHPTFFRFCDELLERYRDDERVMHVSGDNFQFGRRTTPYSYYFSAVTHCWGWATWRRAWARYDVTVRDWPRVREGDLLTKLWGPDSRIAAQFRGSFDRVHAGTLDTWDSQWNLSCWMAGGWAVLPAVNLVTNIGFGDDATHTRSARSVAANLPVEPMDFPLSHPPAVERDMAADVDSLSRLAETRNL